MTRRSGPACPSATVAQLKLESFGGTSAVHIDGCPTRRLGILTELRILKFTYCINLFTRRDIVLSPCYLRQKFSGKIFVFILLHCITCSSGENPGLCQSPYCLNFDSRTLNVTLSSLPPALHGFL